MNKFTTQLAPEMTEGFGGAASGGFINPSKWADEVYNAEIPGAMLCCYMLRRFGWPNTGSDPYKNLMSWTLTTPMPGLLLLVTPYLGHQGDDRKVFRRNSKFGCANMHFGYRHSKQVGDKIHSNPTREAFWKRQRQAIDRWWKTKGRKLYTFGNGKIENPAEDVLVTEWSSKPDGSKWGLWKRLPEHAKLKKVQKMQMHWLNQWPAAHWRLGEFIKKNHPEVKLPKMRKREKNAPKLSRFAIQCRAAIRATLRDLMRPTHVRDISINPFGDIERAPLAIAKCEEFKDKQSDAGYFAGAGNAPSYWYSKAAAKERAAANKKIHDDSQH